MSEREHDHEHANLMERTEVLAKAATWMQARGWKAAVLGHDVGKGTEPWQQYVKCSRSAPPARSPSLSP